MVNKHSILNTLIKTKLKKIKEMGDHVVLLASQFSRLAATETNIKESMTVAILLVPVSVFTELASVISVVDALLGSSNTWDYVSMLFMNVSTRISQSSTVDTSNNQSANGTIATSKRRTPVRSPQGSNRRTLIRCYKRDRSGHTATESWSKGIVAPEGPKRRDNIGGKFKVLFCFKETYGKCSTVITKNNADSFITDDSVATVHAVSNLDYFEKVGAVEYVKLTTADGATAVVTHIGKVLDQAKSRKYG